MNMLVFSGSPILLVIGPNTRVSGDLGLAMAPSLLALGIRVMLAVTRVGVMIRRPATAGGSP